MPTPRCRRSRQVVVLYNGVAGAPDDSYSPDEILRVRREEAKRGGAHLGLDDYEFFDYPEGHFPGPAEFEAATKRLKGILEAFKPDIVYAPWIGEHHLDHHIGLSRDSRGTWRSALYWRGLGI